MVAGVIIEEPSYDDITIGLQIQQFMDEWHYRILHSGVAYEMDRDECVVKALDMFSMHGIEFGPDEKSIIASMPDEADMVRNVVSKMVGPQWHLRKSFEHFALQLQLVVSSATRIRHALEESSPEEIARVMEDGDAGLGQQVLKQAVTEACREVGTLGGLRDSWAKHMDSRIGRLKSCADDAEKAKQELEALGGQLADFSGDQSSKSKKVLLSMSAAQDKSLMQSVMRAWTGYFIKYRMDIDIHKKFKSQIEDMEAQLLAYKQGQLNNVRGVMSRKAVGADLSLCMEVLQLWLMIIRREKEEAGLVEKNAQLQAKLAGFHKETKDNARKVMTRMTAGNEQALVGLCMQAWQSHHEEYKRNKGYEDLVKQQELRVNEWMKKKSEDSKKVMQRMMASTDQGIIAQVMTVWSTMFLEDKNQRQFEDSLNGADMKLSNLNGRQKKAAKNIAERANVREGENFINQVFSAWSTEVKLERISRHYSSKLAQKKHQLQAVQSMFGDFANQLEAGMKNSPRSTRKGGGSSGDRG